MALNYLLSPEFQIVNTAGRPATGGYLEVFVSGPGERYYCASDFNGTLYPFQVPLDSLGSNVVLADDGNAYDVYIYNRYGSLLMSRRNVRPGAGGGIGISDITSSDGSIVVTETENGVDLRMNAQPPSILRATADTLYMDGQFSFTEAQRDGENAVVDAQGKVIVNEGWWHYDATVKLRWPGPAQNETQAVSLYTQNNVSDSMTFDLSYAHNETVQVSGEYKATDDSTQFVLGVTGVPSGMVVELVDFGIHSIAIDVTGDKYNAGEGIVIDQQLRIISIDPDVVQGKLTAGEGITIDSEDNTIAVDFDDVQGKLTAGSNITIDPSTNTISATAAPQQQADWNQTDTSAVDYIKNKPVIPSGVIVDQTYDPTSANAQSGTAVAGALSNVNEVPASSSSDEGKVLTVDSNGDPTWAAAQAPISAGNGISISSNTVSAKVDGTTVVFNVNGELSATASGGGVSDVEVNGTSVVNAQGVAEVTVPTVPTLKELVAGSNITITEGANNVTIAATASTQVQSNWNESDVSSPAYIQNKPSIPSATSDLTNDSGFITLSDVPAQVQSDWNEADTTDPAYVANKPTIPSATSDLTNDSGFITLSDVPAQVNADWTASSGVAEILHKPSIPSATSDLTNDSGFITLSDVPAQVQSDWAETNTSDPSYIANKPTINNVPAVTSSDDGKVLVADYTGGVGSYAWDTVSVPVIGTITI